MPNWCHNTLVVSGEEAELKDFIDKVKTDEQPLTFQAIVPQPSDEALEAMETRVPCTMCGAVGTLPESPEEAAKVGAKWYMWMHPAEREDRKCNVCGGSKTERVGMPGWYDWRCEHWGTKWDASFDGPGIAIGGPEMDVELSVETQGQTVTPTVAIFKFDTAWAPPAPVVEAASDQHPNLEFTLRYAEPGEGYAGEVRFVAGLTLADEELEVEEVLAPEEMWF